MLNLEPTLQPRAWARTMTRPAAEFSLRPLSVIEGSIPSGLRGSLYRNGPGRLQRGQQSMGHWFDGDGAVLAVHFTDDGVTGAYRFVQTLGYQAEEHADQLLFGNYGMTPPGPLWARLGKRPKNTANTSVLALGDRLLALWEAGEPYALDLQTLATYGPESSLGLNGLPYSAHPKRDGQTGEIYNFGVSFGRNATLNLYASGRDGVIVRQAAIPLQGIPLIHDFVLADRYLVFLISPVRIEALPLLLNLKSASDALTWNPELGTEVLVVDRHTLSVVSRSHTDPWFQWHCGNGCLLADGTLRLTLVRYPDLTTNQFLKEVATGVIQTPAYGTFWQIRLEPQTGRIHEMTELIDRGCEFPVVLPQEVGHSWQHTYMTLHRPGRDRLGDLFSAIARFDHQTESLTVADFGEHGYVVEPIVTPDRDNPNRVWVMTVVYDTTRDCSEVWVFEGDRLQQDPVCRIALPSPVAIGFHGTWNAA